MATLHVDVVSAEEAIFSGEAKFVVLPGEAGELGILPGHTPLISRIRPGTVKIVRADQGEENIFVAGGIPEVQPGSVTVLADTAIRAADLDEARAWKRASALKRRCATPRTRPTSPWSKPSSRCWRRKPWPRASCAKAAARTERTGDRACPGSERSGLWPLSARPCLRILACRHLAFTTNSPERSATLAFSFGGAAGMPAPRGNRRSRCVKCWIAGYCCRLATMRPCAAGSSGISRKWRVCAFIPCCSRARARPPNRRRWRPWP